MSKTGVRMDTMWRDFSQEKPAPGQVCIVAAGPDCHAQHLALIWDDCEQQFYWVDDAAFSQLDPFPTEMATHWMPWPKDPAA